MRNTLRTSPIMLCLFVMAATDGRGQQAQTDDPVGEIRRVALDYGEGWYEGDAERMKRALHPELAKRMVYKDPASGRSRLNQQGAMTLVENTAGGGGKTADVEDRGSVVTVFDVYENAASAKVEGPEWVDYLHLVKWNGRWVILNVMWELRPERRATNRPRPD